MSKHSDRRLKENEIIFREANQNIREYIEEEVGQPDSLVPFYCECSKITCRQRINITPNEYKAAHRNERHFIVIPDHEDDRIEKVIRKTADYSVVEKFGKMPHKDALDIALTRLAAE